MGIHPVDSKVLLPRLIAIVFSLILGAGSVAISLALLEGARPAYAGMLCVKPLGGDGCEATVNAALAHAQEGDLIRVAAGTYTENVLISQTVTLQGGWAPDFSLRDLNIFSSTIRPANNTQSVVSILGHSGDPSAVVPTLDGFVISGGRADLGSNHGGGLRIIDSNAVVISNTIKDNVAFLLGGGVWVQRGAPVLQGNQIMNNRSVGLGQDAHGGGVQLENTQAALLDNLIASNIVSGTQVYGGGVEIVGTGVGQVVLRRNTFISNTATTGLTGFGGALALNSGQVLLENSSFISNTASTRGGGIFISGSLKDCCNLTSQDNLIQANTAAQGGGMAIGGSIDDCCQFTGDGDVFRQNSAGQGGGMYNDDQYVALRGSMVFSNTAVTGGGGLLISAAGAISLTNSAAIANQAGGNGGAILNSGIISISNVTVSGNSAGGMGGGIANFNMANLVNATVSDNASADGAGFFNNNTVNTLNSLVALNHGDNCLGVLNSQGHNLEDGGTCALGQPTDMSNTPASLDPLEDNGGSTPTHALAADSPAIDAGDNAACANFDQRGVPRPIDGDGDGQPVCDIGAYEFQIPSTLLIQADEPDPSQPGESFTVTFSVTAAVGLPTGAVTITVSDDPGSCSDTLAGGMGSCALTLSTPGTYTLTAAYASDDHSFVSSTANEGHVVEIAPHLYLPVIRRE
jgi:hypothetical protein